MMLCSIAATSMASLRPLRPSCSATSSDTEKLRGQLDELHSEAENTRNKATNARLRLLRLSEAAEKLRKSAAISVGTGKENEARELLFQKKKVMQALEKTKRRIELLDDLSTKLIEAISIKESQLIGNIALDLESSTIDASSPVRIVSPKWEADEDSDDVKQIEFNEFTASEDQDSQPCADEGKIIYVNEEEEDAQTSTSMEIQNAKEVIGGLKGILSYEEFIEHLDKQLERIEAELVAVLRVSALVLEDEQTNWKLQLTKELLDNIGSIRQRLIGIEIRKMDDR